jgi:hypothetical protein
MRGSIEIDKKTGKITDSQLSRIGAGATISYLPEEDMENVGVYLTQIL